MVHSFGALWAFGGALPLVTLADALGVGYAILAGVVRRGGAAFGLVGRQLLWVRLHDAAEGQEPAVVFVAPRSSRSGGDSSWLHSTPPCLGRGMLGGRQALARAFSMCPLRHIDVEMSAIVL